MRGIDIQAGMNLETKNSDYAPQERTLYFGPNLQFRVGPGFLNVGFNIEPVWHTRARSSSRGHS